MHMVRAKTCGNVRKHVETCGNVWKHVETCGNVRKHVETCGNVWKHVTPCEIMLTSCGNILFRVLRHDKALRVLKASTTIFTVCSSRFQFSGFFSRGLSRANS